MKSEIKFMENEIKFMENEIKFMENEIKFMENELRREGRSRSSPLPFGKLERTQVFRRKETPLRATALAGAGVRWWGRRRIRVK